ncbi:MAG: manganese efflux pump [candidate division WOR-3 bacterium]|nr:MAG: manganese efflux pump [candidate division WOR-3 bacterium]
MNILVTFFIALGLALDAFAVAVSSGIAAPRVRFRHALKVGMFFGIFQAGMPIIGWTAGSLLSDIIGGIDHWVSFVLLCFIGMHMMYEALQTGSQRSGVNPLDIHILLLLSVATSVDALAAGVSFAFLDVAIVRTILIIGIVTFLLSFFGYYLGDRLGAFFKKRIRIIGGLILVIIGVKILLEHI